MLTKETVLAALKKLGPCKPGELADHLEVERPVITAHLKPLLDSGEVKATGATMSRRIALADQKFDEPESAPPAAQAAQAEGRPQGEAASQDAPRGPARGAHRALHPHGRRGLAPGHRQRRRAADLHRAADRGDRLAPPHPLQGLNP